MSHSNIDVNVAVSVNQPPTPPPPARKRRQRRANQLKISKLLDLEAWPLDNAQIAAADRASWKSTVYGHFNMTLERHPRQVQAENGISANPADSESEDEWLLENKPGISNGSILGSIESYLHTEPVPSESIRLAGGPLKYWEAMRSSEAHSALAKFAINHLSAPASSVDAERAFSCGRLMTNHLQHQMCPDTFCAKMAIQS
ncbi:hypothetical protein FRC08_015004 [Ceratobasidium sp. 394]|nr:hypothetical protein FRC08_015004 [Ceratobasidium sp. 394]